MLADIASSIREWLATELSPGTEIGFDSPSLLSTVELELLGAHVEQDCLAVDFLRGSLSDLETALPVRIGWSPTVWGDDFLGAIRVPMRAALELVVTVPVLPTRFEPAPPPVRALDLDVHDTMHRDLTLEPPQQRWRLTSITQS